MGYRKMYLKIECTGKCFGGVCGREGKTMGSHCHCGTLQPTMFRERPCGGGHQAEESGKSQGMMNCGMHCQDTLSRKGLLP